MNELNGLHIAVLIISGFLLLALLLYLFRSEKTEKTSRGGRKKPESEPSDKIKPCPLCGKMLRPGEKVHSVLYPGTPDSMMEIFGCPYCESSEKKRICPVCKKEMPHDAVLIARVFEKPGKKHVHVLGCSICYSGRSKPGKR